MLGSTLFSCAVSRSWAWYFRLVVLALALHTAPAYSREQPAANPDHAPAAKAPSIVCLHTEYLPIQNSSVPNWRLLRELGRQALLIAARDELGLSTRDETLGELFPETASRDKQDLFVFVRCQFDGSVRFQLWSAAKLGEVLPAKKDKPHDARVILNEVEKLEPMIHGELPGKLRALGFEGKAKPANEKNMPPDSVEGQLLEMNFVSQFAAVRAAHAAIADKGESRAWLAVLARGYANLSLMTEHHWKSDTEAFAARALLYAERMVASHPNDWQAHAARAYVRAIVGLHGAALEEFQQMDKLRSGQPDPPALPGWVELIQPYCSIHREPVQAIGQQRPSMRQLAQRLSFEQYRAFSDERWLFDSAKQTMSVCPEEYGVYAMLTVGNASLSVGRTGAHYAPAALAHFLPQRIATLEGLPKSVRDVANGIPNNHTGEAKEHDEKAKTKDEKPATAATQSAGQYAAATIPIVEALRAASHSAGDKGEPSWSALGELIFEEQFVQAANYLHISLNATESSHADEVAAMLPAIKGHRYERFIESFAVNASREPKRFREIIGDMPIVDARGNMMPMMTRVWYLPTESGRNARGCDASRDAFYDRSLTFTGMLEVTNTVAYTWWDSLGPQMLKLWAEDYRAISPHSPQVLRIESGLVEKPTYEQVARWESEAGEDPTIFTRLGTMYFDLEQYDDAMRCYERSIALSPTKDAYVDLAYTHRAAGQEEMWLPTLERFFKVDALGLEHAAVHQIIANDFIDKGKWAEAEPHAVAAAETWSAWGLLLASRVCEGLGHWDDSEKCVREASTNYPTGSGDEWYFWCRRTGRGDLDSARKLMDSYLQSGWIKTSLDGQLKLLTYHLLENDPKSALENAQKAVELASADHNNNIDREYEELHLAFVARERNKKDVEGAAIKEIRRLSEELREKHPHYSATNIAICDILDGKPPADDVLATIDQYIERQPKAVRCNCEYFLGRAYDLAGDKDKAEKYWKQCVTLGPFDRYNATLAGKYLCDRHKTSRPQSDGESSPQQ